MSIARHSILIMGFLSFLFCGCDRPAKPLPQAAATPQAKPLHTPPEITSEEEEGFHDLVFYIEEHKKLPDGSQSIHAAGTHKGRPVGFEVVINAGHLTYRSTGPESDAFVEVLDEIYGTKIKPKAMVKERQLNAVSLQGDPGQLDKGPVQIKLFFEPGRQEDYVELFTNIDLAAHRLEFREKDEEYRPAVVRALRAP